MADDNAEAFIKAVEPILSRNYGVTVGDGVDSSALYENASYPRVEWRYDDGRIEPAQKTGSVAGAFYTDVQQLVARCLGADRAETRILMHNLLCACREASNGPSIRPTRYKWLTEDGNNTDYGAALDIWIEFLSPVLTEPSAYPTPTFVVTSQTQATSVKDPQTGHTTLA